MSCGQAQKLHLDLNDGNAIYTSIMVLCRDRRSSGSHPGTKVALLANLLALVPKAVRDMVFFNASELLQLSVKLDDADEHKRTDVTTFACAQMANILEHPPPGLRPPLDSTLNFRPLTRVALEGTG